LAIAALPAPQRSATLANAEEAQLKGRLEDAEKAEFFE